MIFTAGVVVATPAGGGGDVLLLLVVDVGLEVELLYGALEGGVADAAAVELLELEALAEVVVEGDVSEGVEAGAEVFVALGVGVEDAGDDDAGCGGWGGGRDDGRGELSVALGEVEGGAVARGSQGTVGIARTRARPALKVVPVVVERSMLAPPVMEPFQSWKKPAWPFICLSNAARSMR